MTTNAYELSRDEKMKQNRTQLQKLVGTRRKKIEDVPVKVEHKRKKVSLGVRIILSRSIPLTLCALPLLFLTPPLSGYILPSRRSRSKWPGSEMAKVH